MKPIKTPGILVAAAMALSAVLGVSSASAFTMFNSDKVGATLAETDLKASVLTITGSETKCTNTTYTGSTEGLTTTSQKLTPKWEGCTSFGLPSTFTNNNCRFNLTIGTPSGNTIHLERIDASKPCELTKVSKSIFGECHVQTTEQTIGGVTYLNDPSKAGAIIVYINASGITVHVTKSTGVCPLTVGTHTTVTWTGEMTFTASGANISVS